MALALLRLATVPGLLLAASCGAPQSDAQIPTVRAVPTFNQHAFQFRWNGIYARLYPDCVGISTVTHNVGWVQSIIAVTPGGDLRRLPYTTATMQQITATFEDDVAGNELNTIGACHKVVNQ